MITQPVSEKAGILTNFAQDEDSKILLLIILPYQYNILLSVLKKKKKAAATLRINHPLICLTCKLKFLVIIADENKANLQNAKCGMPASIHQLPAVIVGKEREHQRLSPTLNKVLNYVQSPMQTRLKMLT